MKINCTSPVHDDANASMELYDDSGYCFACGFRDYEVADKDIPKCEPENIQETISRILRHPKKQIRGLDLHYSEYGYYILWPDNTFYKLRRWDDTPRYQGPRGHQPPPLKYLVSNATSCIVIEGEINALTLHTLYPTRRFDIISTGSATTFHKSIDLVYTYKYCCGILDRDPAGVAAGVDWKRKLLKSGKRVDLVCVQKDYNDILQEEGSEGVKKAFTTDLGL